MKGIADEPQYSVGLLEGGTGLCDVIDSHIDEQTLVRDFYNITNIPKNLYFQNKSLYCIVCCILFGNMYTHFLKIYDIMEDWLKCVFFF